MGFRIATANKSVTTIWAPIDTTTGTSMYVGQLCKLDTGSVNGVAPLAAASGASDVTGDQCIFGIIIGTNDQTATYDSTYGQYLLGTNNTKTEQLARKYFGAEGMFRKNDPQPLVKVALLDSSTIIEGDIYNATLGTPPTVVTATAVNGTAGLGMTTGSCDVATVANMCTTYCRSGANAGLYRVNKSASATVHTFDTYWPYTLAVGDTFVIVPMRVGLSFVQITETVGYLGMGFSSAATAATNYFAINVLELRLETAYKESVLFTFSPAHFQGVRA